MVNIYYNIIVTLILTGANDALLLNNHQRIYDLLFERDDDEFRVIDIQISLNFIIPIEKIENIVSEMKKQGYIKQLEHSSNDPSIPYRFFPYGYTYTCEKSKNFDSLNNSWRSIVNNGAEVDPEAAATTTTTTSIKVGKESNLKDCESPWFESAIPASIRQSVIDIPPNISSNNNKTNDLIDDITVVT